MTQPPFDALATQVMTAAKDLSLVVASPFVVLDEEREALAAVIALVQGWSIEDRQQ